MNPFFDPALAQHLKRLAIAQERRAAAAEHLNEIILAAISGDDTAKLTDLKERVAAKTAQLQQAISEASD